MTAENNSRSDERMVTSQDESGADGNADDPA
jgi:hypothetical protein